MGSPFRHFPLAKFRGSFWRFFSFSPQFSSEKQLSSLRSPKGSAAIIMAFIFMVVASLIVVAGTQLVKVLSQQTRQQELYVNEAKNAARAGLQDAKNWFIRQSNQPVAAALTFGAEPTPFPTFEPCTLCTPSPNYTYVDQAFNPQYNSSNPLLGDTLNATIGIENEFSPQGAANVSVGVSNQTIWDRYEVYKQAAPPAAATPYAVHDISGERVNGTWNGSGLEWSIVSYGYVYQRKDFRKNSTGTDWVVPYNQSPNVLLAKSIMGSEIRKISVQSPFGVGSAVYAEYVSLMSISGTGSQVTGSESQYNGAAGVSLGPVTTISGGGRFSSPTTTVSYTCPEPSGYTSINFPNEPPFCAAVSAANQLTDAYVFGMSVTSIGPIADLQGSTGANAQTLDLSNTQFTPKLAYYNGNLTFDVASAVTQYQQLNSSGILVVNGNLTITSGLLGSGVQQVQTYNGIIFVNGNFTLNGGNIDGEVIMGYTGPATSIAGNISINASSTGSPGIISYDPKRVSAVIADVAQYREDISQKRLLVPVPNI